MTNGVFVAQIHGDLFCHMFSRPLHRHE